ncbi:MAG: hypothetical protein ACRELB_20780, partial [Polyangiaceae bacterium]
MNGARRNQGVPIIVPLPYLGAPSVQQSPMAGTQISVSDVFDQLEGMVTGAVWGNGGLPSGGVSGPTGGVASSSPGGFGGEPGDGTIGDPLDGLGLVGSGGVDSVFGSGNPLGAWLQQQTGIGGQTLDPSSPAAQEIEDSNAAAGALGAPIGSQGGPFLGGSTTGSPVGVIGSVNPLGVLWVNPAAGGVPRGSSSTPTGPGKQYTDAQLTNIMMGLPPGNAQGVIPG